jgi:hypothetical protein
MVNLARYKYRITKRLVYLSIVRTQQPTSQNENTLETSSFKPGNRLLILRQDANIYVVNARDEINQCSETKLDIVCSAFHNCIKRKYQTFSRQNISFDVYCMVRW